ncbi:carbohydrate kinase [Clostridium novyi B str. ATCC 27606]|uniref:Carbohydrate kinase n=2 Tax=Clostridium TaxID=1485 RepID=A0AA40M4W7_CLONO|nr:MULTISPECIES: PfkB family carbohydrate kinase [Clostridium]KEI11513.1 carbohydrate kinase [Clostridium novyi B str. NCTC 9691]KEI13455.1 carbohydrate kinase [Clostridium novyi B str. ATCC 27606]KEI16784.1 carbohydrate kinase [Clostridium haemolyticum NCTC 9693]KGN01819.1 carbohydrate kinase [Clostridium haemolyticum NCTC 8350]OOB75027.1 carbohydrate kinase [Clostridium haemolyticum]
MENYVVILGTAIMDVTGFSSKSIILGDKNSECFVKLSSGGAARNIAENMARLGLNTKLITVIGDDVFGYKIKKDCKNAGIDLSYANTISGEKSATYISLIDGNGDMQVGLTDLHIRKEYTIDFIKTKIEVFKSAQIIVITPEVPIEIIRYIHKNCPSVSIMADVASVDLAENVKKNFGVFHTIKANNYEVLALTGIKVTDDKKLEEAADYLIKKGTRVCLFTMGSKGVFYKNKDGIVIRTSTRKINHVISVTGAGDAFTAGYLYSLQNNKDINYSLQFAMGMALATIFYDKANNPNITPDLAYNTYLKYKN